MQSARSCFQILMKHEFPRQILGKKNFQIPNFTNICPVESKLFHAYRRKGEQTDTYDKANSRISQICECA
jgi:hypothetical protein